MAINIPIIHRDSVLKILNFLNVSATQAEKLNGDPSAFNFYVDTYLKFLDLKAKNPEQRLYPSMEVEYVWYSTFSFLTGLYPQLPTPSLHKMCPCSWPNEQAQLQGLLKN